LWRNTDFLVKAKCDHSDEKIDVSKVKENLFF